MKKILRWMLATTVLIGLAGCGLKGPLYMPPVEKATTKTEQSKTDNINKKQIDTSGVKPSPTIAAAQ